MSDELTARIAEVLYQIDHPTSMGGLGVAAGWQQRRYTHQAEQVRAVLGETTTEWVALDRWDSGVEEIAYQGHSEADAREMDADILRSRTVTPWTEVPS